MGSPLGPTLANVFLYYHKKLGFKPVVLNLNLLSIEGTLMILFHLKHLIEKFCNYSNLQYNNIRFTSEIENENSISLLDIKMSRDNSRVFTNFGSFIPKSYKYNLLFTLLHRPFKVCPNFELFYQQRDKLKTIFPNNGYPKSFVDFCFKKYLTFS